MNFFTFFVTDNITELLHKFKRDCYRETYTHV